jgi:hypothetical protein
MFAIFGGAALTHATLSAHTGTRPGAPSRELAAGGVSP